MTALARLPAILFLSSLLLCGCGGKAERQPEGFMDTPAHHFRMGLGLLDEGLDQRAEKEFRLALELEEDYPPAVAGLGLVKARAGDRDEALELIDDAREEAEDLPEETPVFERAWPRVMALRAWTALVRGGAADPEELLEEIEDPYEEALEVNPDFGPAHHYMGEAHVAALRLREAEAFFARAVESGGEYAERSRRRWRTVQDVLRVSPGSAAGKSIALVEELSRAEMAALLVEEIGVASFYQATERPGEASFREPGAEARYYDSEPYDIEGHPMAESVREVLEAGVKGLAPHVDGSFRPDEPLSRAEAAMIYEDLLVRATGNWELGVKFVGRESPFPDLSGEHPAFNAAMLAVTRGLMHTPARTARFDPSGSVSGVEALSALNELESELRLFD
jgi:tetratricopeptide (TPR) repeat protein